MNRNIVIAAASLVFVGLLAVAWALSSKSQEPAAASPTKPDAVVNAADGVSKAEFEALVERVKTLEAEVQTLRQRTDGAAPVARITSPTEARQRLKAMGQADERSEDLMVQAIDEEGSQVRSRVQELVRDEMAIAQEERVQKRVEGARQRITEQVDDFADEHGLNNNQRTKLKEVLGDEREAIIRHFSAARSEGMPRDQARKKAMELRQDTDHKVGQWLDASQLEAYNAKRQEEMERWRGGSGRRR